MTLKKGWAEEGGRLQAELDRRAQPGSPRWREIREQQLRTREWQESSGRRVDGYGRDTITLADFGGPRRRHVQDTSKLADAFAEAAREAE